MNNPINKDSTLFPVCEYRARFGDYHDMKDSKHWNAYARSVDKRHPDSVKQYQFTFLQRSEQTTELAKNGTFFNAFHFSGHKKAIKPGEIESQPDPTEPSMYDAMITYQRSVAQWIVEVLKAEAGGKGVTPNCDNGYTCVLLDFGMPQAIGPKRGWVNFLSILFVAIMDKLAYDGGLNIEMVRRASFGQLRPSVSDCEPSLRVNLGLIPGEYARLIARGIIVLNAMVNDPKVVDWFKQEINVGLFSQGLMNYTKKGANKVAAKGNVWDMLWGPCDAQKKSGMTQIGRTEEKIESIIDEILFRLITSNKSLENIVADKALFQQCFVRPFGEVLETLRVNKNTVQVEYARPMKSFSWKNAPIAVSSDSFYMTYASFYLRSFTTDQHLIEDILSDEKRNDFYIRVEALTTSKVFSPDKSIQAEDGYGSDSDIEYDFEESDVKRTVWAKKLICATGMRSIQLAFYAIKYVKSEETGKSYFASNAITDHMYYETEEALKDKHNIRPPFDPSVKYHRQFAVMKIAFLDLNFANTKNEGFSSVLSGDPGFLVLDVTSSTMQEMANAIHFYLKCDMVRAVLLVSSGLKNEQAMTDRNHYGTVRIFSKEKKLRDDLYRAMTGAESICYVRVKSASTVPLIYRHPRESHLLRKAAKQKNWVPTNKKIVLGGNGHIHDDVNYDADTESSKKVVNPRKK